MNSGSIQPVAGGEGGTGKPSVICQANKVPTRVIVRNNNDPADPTFLWLSFDETTLSALAGGPQAGNVYRLRGGAEDVFVLQPGQTLYAIAWSGALGTTSPVDATWAISDEFPFELHC